MPVECYQAQEVGEDDEVYTINFTTYHVVYNGNIMNGLAIKVIFRTDHISCQTKLFRVPVEAFSGMQEICMAWLCACVCPCVLHENAPQTGNI